MTPKILGTLIFTQEFFHQRQRILSFGSKSRPQ